MERREKYLDEHRLDLLNTPIGYVITYTCVDFPTAECDGFIQGTSVGPATTNLFKTEKLALEYLENVIIPDEVEELKQNFFEEDGYTVEVERGWETTHEVMVNLYFGEHVERITKFNIFCLGAMFIK